jgi:putative methionine-R-sulfoxide reductase with GAF domain
MSYLAVRICVKALVCDTDLCIDNLSSTNNRLAIDIVRIVQLHCSAALLLVYVGYFQLSSACVLIHAVATSQQIEHWPVHKKTCGKTAAELQEQAVEDTVDDTASASGGSSAQGQTSVVVPLVAPHGEIYVNLINARVGTTKPQDPTKVPRNCHGDKRYVH